MKIDFTQEDINNIVDVLREELGDAPDIIDAFNLSEDDMEKYGVESTVDMGLNVQSSLKRIIISFLEEQLDDLIRESYEQAVYDISEEISEYVGLEESSNTNKNLLYEDYR